MLATGCKMTKIFSPSHIQCSASFLYRVYGRVLLLSNQKMTVKAFLLFLTY